MNKNFYSALALAIGLLLTTNVFGQRVVSIAASTDPSVPTDIFPVIMGDTIAGGARTDNNTIYKLENGQVYVTSGRLVNTNEWTLHIEAENLSDTDNKPIIARRPNASGEFQDIGRPEGDVTFRNLWIIVGERGPLEEHDWGRFRVSGTGSRVVIKDCIMEKDRGGFLQFRADSVRCFIDNCIFRNGGNRRILQGNGRGVDLRNFVVDTLVITNTIAHNLQDRFVRSMGAVVPHNYIRIDHCTSFNTAGRHGHIQLGRVITAEITNNLFINPIMLGSTPAFTDEQTQPDNGLHKVITLDTLYANTSLTIASNNIFWTQDVTDYWATNDSVEAPGVLSDLIKQHLGDDTASAYFSEPIELESVPGSILQYVVDLYADPSATDMYDIIVEDVAVAGTPFDSGNLFDFSTFSTCYDVSSTSATASTTGGPVGAVVGCDFTNSIGDQFHQFGLSIHPNPVGAQATFEFSLERSGKAQIEIYDLSGRQMAVLTEEFLPTGDQRMVWNVPQELSNGIYLARLSTNAGVQSLKFLLN